MGLWQPLAFMLLLIIVIGNTAADNSPMNVTKTKPAENTSDGNAPAGASYAETTPEVSTPDETASAGNTPVENTPAETESPGTAPIENTSSAITSSENTLADEITIPKDTKNEAISSENTQSEATSSENTTSDTTPSVTTPAANASVQTYSDEALARDIANETPQAQIPEDKDAEGWLEYGRSLARQGKYMEALDAFEKAIKINPNIGVPYGIRPLSL